MIATKEYVPFEEGGQQNDSSLGWACALCHLMGKMPGCFRTWGRRLTWGSAGWCREL